ncbi:uncharacterized protein ISCGN_019637 [Ixodes scapularis]
MAAARQDGSRYMCLTGPTGDVLAPSSSAAPEEILPTPADGGIYSDDCNQAFPSKLHWDNTFTVKKEPIEFPPPWSVEDRGLGAPDCMSSLQGQTEGRCRNCFLHETHGKFPLMSRSYYGFYSQCFGCHKSSEPALKGATQQLSF